MPLCRFDSGLGPGFLIGLFVLIRHDTIHIAMADTPRNSAADRIKNSTEDSILKSYRGMPSGGGGAAAGASQRGGEREVNRLVQPWPGLAALGSHEKRCVTAAKGYIFLMH